jgi:hypothetical protein
MSREDFIAVAARLFSVYIVLTTIMTLASLMWSPSAEGAAGSYAIGATVVVGFAAYLWFFPLTIARKLLPVMREPRSEESLDASVALALGITLIGLWFLAQAVTKILYWAALAAVVARHHEDAFEWTPQQYASMVSTAVEFVVALTLVLGSNGIRKLLYRLRYGNAPTAKQEAQ